MGEIWSITAEVALCHIDTQTRHIYIRIVYDYQYRLTKIHEEQGDPIRDCKPSPFELTHFLNLFETKIC